MLARSQTLERCSGEDALQVWVSCEPCGFVLDERRAAECVPAVLAHVAERAPRSSFQELNSLFIPPAPGEQSVYMRLLRPRDGVVHFVNFWRALSEVACMAGVAPTEGLEAEIETLRDQLLRRVDDPRYASQAGGVVALDTLVDEVHRAAGMSACPRFWQRAAASLAQQGGPTQGYFTPGELAKLLLEWVNEAVLWTHDNPAASLSLRSGAEQRGLPVLLHIYDVSQSENIQTFNAVLASEYSPVKFGGVFHAGVEVQGLEWSFNYSPSKTKPGISVTAPRKHPHHHYRQTVDCGRTRVPFADITEIISQMLEEYPGQDYNLLRRNCCHFADDFLQRLGLDGIPGWVHRLARVGAHVDTALRAAQAVGDAVAFGCGGCGGDGGGDRRRQPRGAAAVAAAAARGGGARYAGAAPAPIVAPSARPAAKVGDRDDADQDLGIFGKLSLVSESTSKRAW